ncbi:MAG: hypothetical protein S4CHLAM81_15430 [Chlamydiales bacterium]|nr:hypothetical protein [Chlamydiales bacterium]
MSYRTLMPCTYDLRHLGPDVSSSVRQVAEGRAALEQGLLAFSATKVLQGMRGLKAPRFNTTPIELTSREVTYSGLSRSSPKLLARHTTGLIAPKQYFASKSIEELGCILRKKFGPPKSTRKFAETYYNPRTRRSFNLHKEPGHNYGRPHVDVRRRGGYSEKKYDLWEK